MSKLVMNGVVISIFGLFFGLVIGSPVVAATTPNLVQPVAAVITLTAQPRDPTQPPGTPKPKASGVSTVIKSKPKEPVLSSILLSDKRRLAVINNKLVREGGRVAGMTLVRVGKDEVQLQGKNQARPLVLRLPKSNIGKDYR